jgi:hypothetical protein
MSSNLVKTIFYLDPETRQLLEAHAERTGLTISQAARACVFNQLSSRLTIERGQWVELALRMLLRYHPGGDLEKIAEEVIANEIRARSRG